MTDTIEIGNLVPRTEAAAELIADLVPPTPLDHAPLLSETIAAPSYLKREDTTAVHSFKVRGALHAMLQLTDDELDRGVLAASAGNHAQGVALAARSLGATATIVMPRTTPDVKVSAVRRLGGDVIQSGDSYSDAFVASQKLLEETGATFVHPFDDPNVIIGQATIAHELAYQSPDMTHVFVPVGGGGLIAGVAGYLKSRPETAHVQVIGVEPEDSNAMQQSLQAGQPVTLDHVGIFADGVAVKQVGQTTFDMTRRFVDDLVTVNNDETVAAMERFYEETRGILEPAGALAIAGLTRYANQQQISRDDTAIAICSGANMAFPRLQAVAERSELAMQRQGLYIIELPETPGALLQLCEEVVNGHSITEFRYRLTDPNKARFMVGLEFTEEDSRKDVRTRLETNGYIFDDVSDSSFSAYGKHLVGTARHEARRGPEAFYEVEFPERPGALTEFLEHLGTQWNISLFQYRNNGGDRGKVLIGFQTTPEAADELKAVLEAHTSWHTPVSQEEIDRYSY